MLDVGLIRAAGNGTFHLLPMAQRAVDKCTRLVDRHMRLADAQKITMPLLTPADLWRKSGKRSGEAALETALYLLLHHLLARQVYGRLAHRTADDARSPRETANSRTCT